MKIGILTYHRAHNYGAMLQAYALRTYLQQRDHEVDFVDYWPSEHAKEYKWFKPIKGHSIIRRMVYFFSLLLTSYRRLMRIKRFESFRQEVLLLPANARYTSYGAPIEEKYDYVIVGSDQIWRNHHTTLEYIGFDSVYFCQTMINAAHYASYAASMGVINMSNEEEDKLKNYLSDFSAISVRESSLQAKLADMGFDSTLVCDPTFLLNKNEWNTLLPAERFRKQHYVLYYEMTLCQEAKRYAQSVADKMNCDLIVIPATLHTLGKKNELSDIGPQEFIHAIRDAEFVVSTSFHGTAFSVIFEKQFMSMGAKTNSDRIETLLKSIGIADHYTNKCPEKLNPVIYSQIRDNITAYINQSKAFINRLEQ